VIHDQIGEEVPPEESRRLRSVGVYTSAVKLVAFVEPSKTGADEGVVKSTTRISLVSRLDVSYTQESSLYAVSPVFVFPQVLVHRRQHPSLTRTSSSRHIDHVPFPLLQIWMIDGRYSIHLSGSDLYRISRPARQILVSKSIIAVRFLNPL
jgi:hypothetical protein